MCDSGSIWDSPDGIQCYDLSEGYPNIVYETSIAVMAITNTRTPGTVVLDPNSPAFGMTYRQVVQNAVNYLESAQITKDLVDP